MRSEIMDGILRHIHPIGGIENAKLLEVSPGHAKLSVEITQKALNLYGNVHGGFLFSLCDTAAGMSTYAYETVNRKNPECGHRKGLDRVRAAECPG